MNTATSPFHSTVVLHPGDANLASLKAAFQAETIQVSEDGWMQVRAAHDFLLEVVASGRTVYGVNTGFGSLADCAIEADDLCALQRNLLLSHACGTGEPLGADVVRRMLILKVHGLIRGHSGVAPATVERLLAHLNAGVLPVVPRQGSLGASGDLAPLAHLCLPLLGEGEVVLNGEVVASKVALEELGWPALELGPKEGLALINGTQMMSSLLGHGVERLERLWEWAAAIGSLSHAAYQGLEAAFHPGAHEVRGHDGQIQAAAALRGWLDGAQYTKQDRQWVQDPYCLRCMPQVHGAVKAAIEYGQATFVAEATAVTDNPILLPASKEVLSAGNFHGEPLALVLDHLKVAAAELGSISERRSYKLLGGHRGLPAFLVANPGLHSGLMIVQYTAASIVSRNKSRAVPASTDTIDSSNGQEDHVSMGANAAVQLHELLPEVQQVLALELLTASQALTFRERAGKGAQLSPPQKQLLDAFRAEVPPSDEDVFMSPLMAAAQRFVGNHSLNAPARA